MRTSLESILSMIEECYEEEVKIAFECLSLVDPDNSSEMEFDDH